MTDSLERATATTTTASRRHLLAGIVGGIAVIPLSTLLGCSENADKQSGAMKEAAQQQAPTPQQKTPADPPVSAPANPPASKDLIRLEEQDPVAQALGYQEDATKVDVQKYPRRAGPEGAKQFCHNCTLYAGEPSDKWAACSLFPGKKVAAEGWCNGYIAKG